MITAEIPGSQLMGVFNNNAMLQPKYLSESQPKSLMNVERLAKVIAMNVQPNLVKEYSTKMNVLRFIAMCSVVWGHSLLNLQNKVFHTYNDQLMQAVVFQIGKIGTVLFFLISGFLLSDKIMKFNLKSYLNYRLFSLILPWIFFLVLLVCIQVCQALSISQIFNGQIGTTLVIASKFFIGAIFHSAYWFIPVSIISALILVQFKNYRNKMWMGILLGAIAVFYSINLYYSWIPASHTKAFAGYIFFMWLGLTIKTHIYTIQNALDKISWWFLTLLFVLTFVIACREGMLLTKIGSADAFASNRASNALLCLTLFFIFLKSNSFRWINWLNPQKNSYGIYLIHCVVIVLLVPFANHLIALFNMANGIPELMVSAVLFFLAVLGVSLIIVSVLRHSALRFIIGARG